eukprot:4103424-Pyramimonas_sp.AAC.1
MDRRAWRQATNAGAQSYIDLGYDHTAIRVTIAFQKRPVRQNITTKRNTCIQWKRVGSTKFKHELDAELTSIRT